MHKYLRIFYIKQIKYSLVTFAFGLIPVFIAAISFQLFLDTTDYNNQISAVKLNEDYDIKMLLYYLISGFVHIIICVLIIGFFKDKTKVNIPRMNFRLLKNIRGIMLIVAFLLVIILDKLQINIAYLSHERLYILLAKSKYFAKVFEVFPRDFLPWLDFNFFHAYSFFPFFSICIALTVMIYGSFYIGKELFVFLDCQELNMENIKSQTLIIKSTLKKYAQQLSIVLVSSTIATILFLQVPVPLIENPVERANYSGVSVAMGVCWGAIFTLTLLFLCIYPYILVHRKMTSIVQSERVNSSPELEHWIDNHTSYYSLMVDRKLIISVLSPAATSILSAIISKGIF